MNITSYEKSKQTTDDLIKNNLAVRPYSTKMEATKGRRKAKKFAARKNINCSENPTNNIVLCNVGQATGLQKDKLLENILKQLPNISVPKYIPVKGESYSYLVFENLNDSLLFYEQCHGKLKMNETSPPVYMAFVLNVPITEAVLPSEYPKGLFILENFISAEEEALLVKTFDWAEDPNAGHLKNRQVKHYGYEFRYGSNDVDLTAPLNDRIPECCSLLWSRLNEFGYELGIPDQLTVNKYHPGQGIPSHVDRHSPFGDTILSLSLGGSVVMDWRHHSGKNLPIVVSGRSMMIMTDEARYDWQHGIQPRTWDPAIETRTDSINSQIRVMTNDTTNREVRISLTFRWTRSGPCECRYKTLCDSRSSRYHENIEDDMASNLEDLHVHQVYEKIAGHFSTTRHKPWPKVVEFMDQVPIGSVVLDLGCGNGKNILKRDDIVQIAGERSSGLLSECKNHIRNIPGADCLRLDLLNTTLRDECADYVICIAVIHHFSSKIRRIQAIATIARLLRSSGKALITVWAKDQTKSNYLCKTKNNQELTKNEEIVTVGGLNLPVHENRTQFQHTDLLVPWKLRNINENKMADQPQSTLLRYYHVFEENELSMLCSEVSGIKVERSFYEEGNWCVVCSKE